jgi:hypothetical protein
MSGDTHGGQIRKIIHILCVLLDCCEHRVLEFRHLEYHPKTVKRILDVLAETSFVRKRKTLRGYSYQWIGPLQVIPPDRSMKRCSNCHQTKPIQDFNRSKTNADLHQFQCRVCQKENEKAYYAANRERLQKAKRLRMQRYRARERHHQTIGVNS